MRMVIAHGGGAVVRLAGRLDGEAAERLSESQFRRGLCWAAPITQVIAAA